MRTKDVLKKKLQMSVISVVVSIETKLEQRPH